MARALKVYRTPIGFHDAYVAAPSQKAALAAWGTKKNLFARGDAGIVTDAKLTKGPLADPGAVIRLPRGSAADYAALPVRARPTKPSEQPEKPTRPPPAKRPSRPKLDKAEAALARADKVYLSHMKRLAREQATLDARKDAAERAHKRKVAALQRAVDEAEAHYQRAMSNWRR